MPAETTDHIPFFSVVTCTYNRAGMICRALDSLLGQTDHDWECIIVDDASTDDTEKVVAPYLDKGFRYIRHSHRGCALSKNAGMLAARGKYITFLDSDDEYKPGHLAVRHDMLLHCPDTDLLFSDVEVTGNRFVPDRNNRDQLIDIADCTVGGTFVIRRASLGPSDVFEDIFSEDAAFLQRFSDSGRTIKKISSPTYVYHRDSDDSICNI